ncbi:MAG: D-serine ammonia-lyase [Clostridia bacterium]|nr:D-serine ammonia-lyase [Clostridia bacterium]
MKTRTTDETERVMDDLRNLRETFWVNPDAAGFRKGEGIVDPEEAESLLRRFAPFLAELFPETGNGIVESPLLEIPSMKAALEAGTAGIPNDTKALPGRIFIKCDHMLPIAGSVKARGGVYEVLKFAEETALREGILRRGDDLRKLGAPASKQILSRYRVAVGSTGNLGLSIGIISAAIGFSATVHMSSDAKEWKKRLLRENGADVLEYAGDYEKAVAAGRREAAKDPFCHFVDDENSADLFAGYSTAGRRLADQLAGMGLRVDRKHRLYVAIPAGVGGAPGGILYGLKEIFGDDVIVVTAEPTHAPAVILGLASGKGSGISAGDLGIDGDTAADGLAVGRPSALACRTMKTRLNGACTVDDERLFAFLGLLWKTEGIFLEPSAAAGFAGLLHNDMREYPPPDGNSIRVVWATGGSMVPEAEKQVYLSRALSALAARD